MEITGGSGPAAQDLLRSCARAAASRADTSGGESPMGSFYQSYLQRISVALQRSYAHCIRAWGARGEGPSPSEALGEGLNSAWEAAQHSLRYGPDPLEQSDLHFIASPLQ
jgi:hypothetical protein